MKNITWWLIILTLSLFIHYHSVAQRQAIDSLQQAYQNVKEDTTKILIQLGISEYYIKIDPDSSILISQEMLSLSEKINYPKGIMISNMRIGSYYSYRGRESKALDFFYKSLKLAQELELKEFELENLNRIAINYQRQEEPEKAIVYIKQILNFVLEIKDTLRHASALNNLGVFYTNIGKYDSALFYLEKIETLALTNNIQVLKRIYPYALNNKADIYSKQGKYELALEYYKQSLVEKEKSGDKWAICYTLNGMAIVYQKQGNYSKSIEVALKGFEIAQDLKLLLEIRMISQTLYKTYQLMADYEHAFEYLSIFQQSNDSIFQQEKVKAIANLEATTELEKKDLLIEKERTARKLQQSLTYIILSALLLVLGLVYFIWRGFVKQKKIKDIIVDKNTEISTQNKELKELNSVKDKLFSIISHDLRSPVVNIQMLFQMLNEGSITMNEINELSEHLGKELNEVSTLLDNLLFWAKSQMEKGIVANPGRNDIEALIQENIALITNRLSQKNIKVIHEIKESHYAYFDREMIKLVIRNLLHNAIKFTPEGKNIYVSLSEEENYIYIKIKDEGIGMSPETVENLFQTKTSSFSAENTALGKGTGLGLMLSYEFIEKNNAQITVQSEVDQGSEFCIKLPKS